MRWLISILMLAALAVPVRAEYVISNDGGGSLEYYLNKYQMLNDAGGNVRITGYCWSACTLILSFSSRVKVCVSSTTLFGFHSAAREGRHSDAGTRYLWALYPEHVQKRLMAAGWDGSTGKPHPELIIIRASEFFPVCD